MFFVSLVFIAFAGLFYSILLEEFGLKVKYWILVIVMTIISAISLLFSEDGPGFMVFVYIIGVFILGIGMFVRQFAGGATEIYKTVDKQSRNYRNKTFSKSKTFGKNIAPNFDISEIRTPTFWDYSGVIFSTLSIFILTLCMFGAFGGELGEKTTNYLYGTAIFQVKSSIMLMLIGLINPFVELSESTKEKIRKIKEFEPLKNIGWFIEKVTEPTMTLKIVKSFLVALVVAFFLKGSFFALPWKSGIFIVTLYLGMVLLFIGSNLYRMVFQSKDFALYSMARFVTLIGFFYPTLFATAILTFSLLFFSSIFGWNTNNISSEGLLLIGFNIVMGYVSWKIARR